MAKKFKKQKNEDHPCFQGYIKNKKKTSNTLRICESNKPA